MVGTLVEDGVIARLEEDEAAADKRLDVEVVVKELIVGGLSKIDVGKPGSLESSLGGGLREIDEVVVVVRDDDIDVVTVIKVDEAAAVGIEEELELAAS